MRSNSGRLSFGAVLCVTLALMSATAGAQVFNFSFGSLSARATFSVVGTDLHILLQNTATTDATVPSSVLTALFFDVGGSTLTPSSLGFGTRFDGGGLSSYVNGTSSDTPGQHWGARNNLSPGDLPAFVGNQKYGIGTAGLGIFSTAFAAGGSPPVIDGIDYGLVGTSTSSPGGPGAPKPQIWDSVEAVLHGTSAPGDVSHVKFIYGTAFGETPVPTPNAALVLLTGGGLAWVGVLRQRLSRRRDD